MNSEWKCNKYKAQSARADNKSIHSMSEQERQKEPEGKGEGESARMYSH